MQTWLPGCCAQTTDQNAIYKLSLFTYTFRANVYRTSLWGRAERGSSPIYRTINTYIVRKERQHRVQERDADIDCLNELYAHIGARQHSWRAANIETRNFLGYTRHCPRRWVLSLPSSGAHDKTEIGSDDVCVLNARKNIDRSCERLKSNQMSRRSFVSCFTGCYENIDYSIVCIC